MPPRDACDGAGGPAARLAARLDAGVRRAWIERAVVVLALSAALAAAAAAVVRPLLPRRQARKACPGCGPEPDRAAGRRATLTIGGQPAPPSKGRRG